MLKSEFDRHYGSTSDPALYEAANAVYMCHPELSKSLQTHAAVAALVRLIGPAGMLALKRQALAFAHAEGAQQRTMDRYTSARIVCEAMQAAYSVTCVYEAKASKATDIIRLASVGLGMDLDKARQEYEALALALQFWNECLTEAEAGRELPKIEDFVRYIKDADQQSPDVLDRAIHLAKEVSA